MDENNGRNDAAAQERAGCGAFPARRRGSKRRRLAGSLALALAAACLGALAGGGAASALYWVGTVASLPAAEVAPAEWARYYEEAGPYDGSDGWGAYCVRYAGSAGKVDAAAALDADGKICGTAIDTTEHMFQGLDANVKEIELPDVSGFDGGVHPDTFGGDLDHEVDLRYRDKDGADRCSALDGSPDAGKATVWLYLEEGNLEKYLVYRTYKGEAKNVYVSESVESLKSLFISNKSIVSCSISDEGTWDSANRMLANCTSLTTLPDGFFNIPVTDTDYMFYRCTSLETIPDGFLSNTSGLIHTYDMFYGCASLKTIPVGFLSDAPSLFNTYDMFAGCTNLESLPEGFLSNAPKIYSIGSMFNGCTSLASLPEGFLANSSNLKEMKEAFSGCNALASLPSGLSLAEGATSVISAFSDCTSLTVDAIPAGFKLPSTVTDAHELFNGCISLEAVPDGLLANAASLQNASSMFAGTGVAAVPDGLLDGTPNLTDASAMFQGAPIATVPENLFKNNGQLADVSSLFSNCGQLVGALDLPSSVTTVDNMVDGAGASAATHPYDDKGENAGDAGAYSVIVRYGRSAATDSMRAYADSVNASVGKARFVPYPWEKVAADDGPYEDPDTHEKFYLRYAGSDPVVDVQDHMDENGAILGVKVATTDRMFQGLDANVSEVVLPNVSGFATDVDPNTFGGNLSHKVDLRYRASLEDAEDHCSTLNAADAANATAWLYLEDSNLTSGKYKGNAKNVYVSKSVSLLTNLFRENFNIVACDIADDRGWSNMNNMFDGCKSLTTIADGFLSVNGTLKYSTFMFSDCRSLTTLPEGFLSNACVLFNASSMFYGCTSLTTLPDGFMSNPTEMVRAVGMFQSCTSLRALPVGFLSDAPKLKFTGSMFSACQSLTSLPSGFLSRSTDLKSVLSLFSRCNALTSLPDDFSLPSTVSEANKLFEGCTSLTAIPDGFLANAASLQGASSMFAGTGLAAVPDGLLDRAPNLKDASAMFQGTPIATVPENLFKNNGKLADVSSLFSNCGQLVGTLDLPSSVVTADSMVDGAGASAASHPYDDKGENAGDAGAYSVIVRYDRSAVTDSMRAYIDGVNGTAGSRVRFVAHEWEKVAADDGPYEDPETGEKFYLRYAGSDPVVDVQDHMDGSGAILGVKVTTTDRMFQGLDSGVTEIILPSVAGFKDKVHRNTFGGDLSHKVDLRYRASGGSDYCSALDGSSDAEYATVWLYLETRVSTSAKNVYVSKSVSSLRGLFGSNKSIVSCDIADGGAWTDASYMFEYCPSLRNLPEDFLSNVPTLVDVAAMFRGCTSLTALPSKLLSGNVNVTSMNYMFQDCTSLSTLPDGFMSNIPALIQAAGMFQGCTSLKSVPDGFLSASINLEDLQATFKDCTSLTTLSDGFLSTNVNLYGTAYMFMDCTSLESLPDGFLSACTGLTDMAGMFLNAHKLQGEVSLPASASYLGRDTFDSVGSEVASTDLAYDDAGINVGPGKGLYAFVVRYPDSNETLSSLAATVNAHGAGYEKVVMVPISGIVATASLESETDDPQPELTEAAPVEDVTGEQGGEIIPPLDEVAPDDAIDEPLPEEGKPDDAPVEPPLPDDPEAAPLPEDGELAAPAPDAPDAPANEPDKSEAAAAGDEARVMVRPEREEGLLSADPPGIVAVAAGGLGVGEYFRRRRDGSKGQD